jgi:hypothetical protein
MTRSSKARFCVRFMATSCYKVTVQAESPKQAVAKARKLWEAKGAEQFKSVAGDIGACDVQRQ